MKKIFSFAGLICFLLTFLIAPAVTAQPASGIQDRAYWSQLLYKISYPVVHNLSQGTLKKNMPVEKAPAYGLHAEKVTYLEAVGRTMAGIAPWLALPDDDTKEGIMRKQLKGH